MIRLAQTLISESKKALANNSMVQQIRELLRATPFVPFTVIMSNGSRHEVRHPENALLSKHFLYVVNADNDELVQHLYLLHVAQLS